ncbi:hypothetical protein ACJMK2_008837, partial [Sinanodonta woodiana]
ADMIRIRKSKETPKETESLRLACLTNTSITQDFGLTLPNKTNLRPICYSTFEDCTRYYELNKSLIDPNEFNVEIKSLNRTRDEGYWECWYTQGGKMFRAGLNLTVY